MPIYAVGHCIAWVMLTISEHDALQPQGESNLSMRMVIVGAVQDGERCRNAVNTAECRFCEYHVASEFRKLQPSRGGFLDSMLSTAFSRRPTQPQKQGAHCERADHGLSHGYSTD